MGDYPPIPPDWTTGNLTAWFLTVKVLGTRAFKAGAYSPWLFHFTIPIGAILFLIRRRQWAADGAVNHDDALSDPRAVPDSKPLT